MSDIGRILLPKCNKAFCEEVARVYVDKTGEDLCDNHGDVWSQDEKIPIQVPHVGTNIDIESGTNDA